jgi:hypothetical protein
MDVQFSCEKNKVMEILMYHQRTCPEDIGYNKILEFLKTKTGLFEYNAFCSKLEEVIRPNGETDLTDMGDRFKNGFLLRMRRYKVGGDWTNLSKPMIDH